MAALRFASLGSGSRGNATVIAWRGGHLLLDCGFSAREASARLARLGLSPDDLSAVLVTHEHSDHIQGVAALARRHGLPVYLTHGTFHGSKLGHNPKQGELPSVQLIRGYAPFAIDGLSITPVAVPHDAREPAQYVFECDGCRLGVLTDLGSITPHVEACYAECDALILEANHDADQLAGGRYPASLKRRVGGQWGHLNNRQAAGFLARLDCARLQHLVVAHISEQNNSPELAREALGPVTGDVRCVTYACQNQGFDWLSVE